MSPDPLALARVDLRWYFDGSAEAELGARGQDYQPAGAGGAAPDQVANRRHEAALREIDVRRRLAAITPEQRRVLRYAFTPTPPAWPIRAVARWYELGGVAALLVQPDDAWAGARRVALMRPEDETTKTLRALASVALTRSLLAYLGKAVADEPAAEMPRVPRAKARPEAPRTWVPRAEERSQPAPIEQPAADVAEPSPPPSELEATRSEAITAGCWWAPGHSER